MSAELRASLLSPDAATWLGSFSAHARILPAWAVVGARRVSHAKSRSQAPESFSFLNHSGYAVGAILGLVAQPGLNSLNPIKSPRMAQSATIHSARQALAMREGVLAHHYLGASVFSATRKYFQDRQENNENRAPRLGNYVGKAKKTFSLFGLGFPKTCCRVSVATTYLPALEA